MTKIKKENKINIIRKETDRGYVEYGASILFSVFEKVPDDVLNKDILFDFEKELKKKLKQRLIDHIKEELSEVENNG